MKIISELFGFLFYSNGPRDSKMLAIMFLIRLFVLLSNSLIHSNHLLVAKKERSPAETFLGNGPVPCLPVLISGSPLELYSVIE